jgi:hypothetical protein
LDEEFELLDDGSGVDPEFLEWDSAGRLYVSDNNQRVYVFSVGA